MSRPNLHVIDNAMALRILFDGNRAIGVEILRHGAVEMVGADRDVILASGAYQSPVLLMVSGIGPAEDLGLFGIEVRESLPVGHNLQDHLMAQLNFETDAPSLFGAFTPDNLALFEKGRGPLTSNIPEAGGFFRTRAGLSAPDVEFHYAPSMFYDEGLTAPHAPGYCFGPVVVKPSSRGRVMLRTPLPDSKPRVLSNFLTTDDDRASVVAGIRLASEIAEQEPLRRLARLSFSVPDGDSDDAIIRFVERVGQSVYHPTSTCAIGAVVDPQLRVYGFDGLRVCDASVMPTITRANTNAATIMIAEKGADLIRERALEPQLAKETAKEMS
jgi:choline dehydrogenase-like flavoprotein